MKQTFLLLIFTGLILNCAGQQKKIDSLRQLISQSKPGENHVSLLNELSPALMDNNPEEALTICLRADSLSKKINFKKGEARALDLMGDALWLLGNYPKSLEVQLASLQLNEALKDSGDIAGCLISLANLYSAQKQYRIAIDYLAKAEAFARAVNDKVRIDRAISNKGSTYGALKMYDSSLFFLQEAYALEQENKMPVSHTAFALSYLHAQLGNPDLGLSYLKMAEQSAAATQNTRLLTSIFYTKALLFKKGNKIDSALFYAEKSLNLSMSIKLTAGIAGSAGLLSYLYQNDPAEALRYHQIRDSANNITNDIEKSRLFQNLAFNESDRQAKIEKEKQLAEEERKHNLQYAAIALGLVIFVVAFLFFSHTIIANQKLIHFLGVLSLLVLFEFVNLLLHPYVGDLTHHSPVFMLLFMVCLAALLIPLHHRLEHWITHKMVEKNKHIRLASAKKTIAELEGNS